MFNCILRTGVSFSCVILLAGCHRATIEGTVRDIGGDALPGVAVTVQGTEYQALTDTLGEYRIRYRPGQVIVRFAKTGYTSGQTVMQLTGQRRVTADDVHLWRLPVEPGVYVFQANNYLAADKVLPQRYLLEDDSMAYGTKFEPSCVAESGLLLVTCYNTPRYDARLSRLREAQARPSVDASDTFPVWVAAGTFPVDLMPIDRPEKILLQLRLEEPLQPGVYAVHWGALNGYTTLDNRIYVFRILEPEPEPTADQEPANDVEDEADGDQRPVELQPHDEL